MGWLIAVLAAVGLLVVVVILVSAKLEQRKAEHRRAMEDLVRGRTSSPRIAPNVHEFGDVAQAFTRKASESAEAATLIQQLQDISRIEKAKAGAKEQARGAAMVRRAERMHAELVAEIKRENRGPRYYPSAPCTLQISYIDADGVWTTRKIAPYKSGNTNQRFDAWCDTRKARRTFYFGRIRGAIDLTTGQSLTSSELFLRIHPGRQVPADFR